MVFFDYDMKVVVILLIKFLLIFCFSNVSSNYDFFDIFRWVVKYLMKGMLID